MSKMKKIVLIFMALLMSLSLSAQTKETCVDTLSSRILLSRGTSNLKADPMFRYSLEHLFDEFEASKAELLSVIVEGSSSPDGLWGNNIVLSQDRVKNAAQYLTSVMKVPAYKIHKIDRHEDWDRLAEMIEKSQLKNKVEALHIIKTLNWGERKTALRNLDGGCFWEELEKNYFPQLRSVSISLLCRGGVKTDKTPVDEQLSKQSQEPKIKKEVVIHRDTVYVRDTVYIIKDCLPKTVEEEVEIREIVYEEDKAKVWDSPWMMGFKTNLLSDAIATPSLGFELQLSKHMSLDLEAWAMACNAFVPSSQANTFYGASPELRWWFGDKTMRQGNFIGLHANVACYDIEWRDGNLYEASLADAWSAGLTYGYSLGLGKKDYWGLEFVVGAGYISAIQNLSTKNAQGSWQLKELQKMKGFGLTKLGINLTYRFSVRKYDETR